MLNKLHFNNLVITNKKKIQQARTKALQKLVQKIRKFKLMQEKKPEDEKTKERLRKNAECMTEMKKLRGVEIMKRILVLDKNPTAILTNGRAVPEELAIAYLASNKLLNELAKKFRQDLKLDVANETWKEELLQTSKRRVKIKRTEEKRQKRKELKEQKLLERKRLEWMQENQLNPEQLHKTNTLSNNKDNDQLINVANTSGIWKMEQLNENEAIEEVKAPKSKQLNEKTSKKKTDFKNTVQPNLKLNNCLNKPKACGIITANETCDEEKNDVIDDLTHVVNPEETKEFKSEHLNETTRLEKTESKKLKTQVKTKPELKNTLNKPKATSKIPAKENDDESVSAEVTHVLDPFFITDNGENYLSTAVNLPMINQEEKREENKHSQWQNSEKSMHALEPRDRTYKHKSKEFQMPAKRIKSKVNVPADNLHPSWAAKMKIKPIISDFQGKKTVFCDETDQVSVLNCQTNRRDKNLINTTKSALTKSSVEDLHPSWLAKQKQKPTIANFQGKKITFDADDE